jgi:NADH:ubiquinone oxidoreductase subunit F (NADH-binding)
VTLTDAPRIVTGRLGRPKSWTLASYLGDGGYEGLRKALSMTPEQIFEHVNTASGGCWHRASRCT